MKIIKNLDGASGKAEKFGTSNKAGETGIQSSLGQGAVFLLLELFTSYVAWCKNEIKITF